MKMKYVSVINNYRDENYFYLIPELYFPKTDDLSSFTVQLYAQFVNSVPEDQEPGNYDCTSPEDGTYKYDTVALAAQIRPEDNICHQSWFLRQYIGQNELSLQPGEWKNCNKDDLEFINQTADDMLFGWDSTESFSNIVQKE